MGMNVISRLGAKINWGRVKRSVRNIPKLLSGKELRTEIKEGLQKSAVYTPAALGPANFAPVILARGDNYAGGPTSPIVTDDLFSDDATQPYDSFGSSARIQIEQWLAAKSERDVALEKELNLKFNWKSKIAAGLALAGALVFPFLGTVGPLFLSAIGISMTKGLFVISGCVTAFLENFLVLTGIRFAWHCKKEGSAAEERFDKSVSLEEKTKEIMRLYENPAEREALAKEIRFLMASDETKETGQQILNLFKYEPQEHNDLTNIMYAQAWLERYSAGQDLTGEELSKIKAVRSQISPELPVAQYLDQVIATLEKPQQDLGIAAETLCKNLAEKEGEDLEELLIFMYNPLEEESGNWDASSYTSEEIKRVEEALGLKKEALEGLPDAESEGSVTQRCIDLIFKILTEFAEARGG